MARVIHEIILLLCLLCGHIYAQKGFDVSPEAFQILATEVGKLSKLVDQQNAVINELQDKFKFQEIVNSELMDRLNQQEKIIEDLSAKLVKQDKSQDKISTGPKSTSNHSSSHSSNKQKKETRHVQPGIIRKRQYPGSVAFFATITQPSENNLGIHQDIVFEDVLTNIGNGYNNNHGVFTAPISGIFLLTSSIRSFNGLEYWAEMVLNGSPIARLNGNGAEGRHGMGTQTAIVYLNKGDDVAIRNINLNVSVWGNKYSSFGGVLLQEFETSPSTTLVG